MPTLTRAQEEQLKILRAAADGTLPKIIEHGNAEFSFEELRTLCEAGFMSAVRSRAIRRDEQQFSEIRITFAGHELLMKLENLALPDQATQPANTEPPKSGKHEWHKNPLLITSLIVVGGVLVVFIVHLLRDRLGLALP